jgi:predicted peroxiredoxin
MPVMLFVATHATDNPFKAIIPFEMAAAAHDSGHEVSIALQGDAVFMMKDEIAAELKCLGAGPFKEALEGVIKRGIPVFACGTCTKARGITEEDLRKHGAHPMNKGVFVELVAQSDNVVTY